MAATTSIATSTPAAVVAPVKASTAAVVLITAPMPWAKRFGGPATYFGSPGATFMAMRASGLSVGPVSTRAQKP